VLFKHELPGTSQFPGKIFRMENSSLKISVFQSINVCLFSLLSGLRVQFVAWSPKASLPFCSHSNVCNAGMATIWNDISTGTGRYMFYLESCSNSVAHRIRILCVIHTFRLLTRIMKGVITRRKVTTKKLYFCIIPRITEPLYSVFFAGSHTHVFSLLYLY
jgi:hypothetical protein